MHQLTILLIDDDTNDLLLMKRALRLAGFKGIIDMAGSAEEAINHLVLCRAGGERMMPDLIILDLRLKWMSGADFLEWLKLQPVISRVPVIVLSGAAQPFEVNRAYSLGARTFFLKPQDAGELTRTASVIVSYWTAALRPRPTCFDRPEPLGPEAAQAVVSLNS